MSRPLVRYTPSPRYVSMLLFSVAGAALSAWTAASWAPAWVAAALFTITALALGALVLRPRIEIFPTHLAVGSRVIRWSEIRGVDRTAWNAPLVLHLTLASGERVTILYPGIVEQARALLEDVQRHARQARIDGLTYREFWAESAPAAPQVTLSARRAAQAPKRYPVLRPEDEREVEMMFQKLKSERRLEQPQSGERIESSGAED